MKFTIFETMVELSVFEMAQIGVDVLLFAAVASLIWYWLPKLRTDRRMVQVMTARSEAVPTDPKLIEEWAEKLAALPKGSKKWIAYMNALKAVGYEK